MLIQPTIQKLKALKLNGMADALQSFHNNPDSEGLSFDERFGILVDREVIHRENKRQSRLLKGAKLRASQACVEDIDYQHARGLIRSKMIMLTQCDWIRRQHNIVFLGPAGVGKTYLACALGQQACRQGFTVKYFRMTRLFEALRSAQGEGKYTALINQLSKTDVLILDDWGLGQLGKNERQDLLEVLEDRHELKSTIITSQLPILLWHEYIGDATIADAILDRLLSGAHKIELTGGSLRKKDPDLDSK
jgi:DNA replication protein DnaC